VGSVPAADVRCGIMCVNPKWELERSISETEMV
jgi:hypothetical protein